MSVPISNDLRQRIVDRYMSHSESYDAVAEYFQVGRATVNRIINRFRRTGSVDPSPRGGGIRRGSATPSYLVCVLLLQSCQTVLPRS
jgi:transposase